MSSMEKSENQIVQDKWAKVEELKTLGLEPFGRKYEKKHTVNDILKFEDDCDDDFKTAGRIMSYRRMGKNVFAHIEDQSGRIQIYVKKDTVGEEAYVV